MKHKFKLTRLWVASLLLLFGFTTNAWADGINFSGGYIYFDNSLGINKGYIQLCARQASWTGVSTLSNSNLSHTKLYYVKDPQGSGWGDILGWVVISNSTAKENSNFDNWSSYGWCTNWNTYGFNSGSTYLIVPSSTSKSQSVTTTYYSTGYSDLNNSQTVYKYTSTGGTTASSYTGKQVNSGTVTISAYKMTDHGKASNSNNSGTINNATTTSVSKDAAYTGEVTLEATANDGYSFIGWFENTTATTAVETETSYTYNAPNSTKSIYARFKENQYSITFDANGGSSTMSDQTGLGCATAQTIKTNEFTAPTGHHFNGWNTASDGTGTAYAAGGTVPALTVTTQGGTLELYAQWEPNTHTLTWEWNGGSTTDQSYTKAGTVAYGTSIVYPTNASMSYAGHNFTGWDKTISTMPDADLTITAQWEVASSYTLSFEKGCDDNVTDMPASITQSSPTFTIPPTLPKRTGYTFSVWKDNQDNSYSAGGSITITGNTTLTAVWSANTNTPYVVNHKRQALDGTYPADLTETENKTGTTATLADLATKSYTGFTTPATQVATILADGSLVVNYQYERQSYTLTWELNGGTAGTGTITPAGSTKYETVLQYTVDPTKKGYTFTGWNPEMISGTTTMPAANTTYSAQWQAKTYTISFNQNGGEGGQTGTVTATYDQAMPGTVTCPTRVGYKFKGYYSAATDGTKYYNADGTATANTWTNDAVGGTATIYAQWTQLNVYIEGRFSVATNRDRNTWLHTGSGVDDWAVESTNIQMEWDETNKYYYLRTWATVKELSDIHTDKQYFNFKQCEGKNISSCTEYGRDGKMGEPNVPVDLTISTQRSYFDSNDRTGYVILYFNESQMWYEIDPIDLYGVTIQAFNGGYVSPSGTQQIGEVAWSITATAYDGYHFNRWTTTGGVHVDNAEKREDAKITATGAGTITANFASNTDLYFQAPYDWAENGEVWVYFNAWWDDTKGVGTSGRPNGKKMENLGNRTYRLTYSSNDDGVTNSNIAFINGQKDGMDPIKNASASYRNDFNHCSPYNWFIAENKKTKEHNDNHTAFYNNGEWTTYYDRVEYYFENSATTPKWQPIEECRFKNTDDHNVKRLVLENVAANQDIEFKVWSTCNCWFGVGKTGCVIQEDTKNYGVGTGDKNVTLKTWKAGSYEIVYHINSNELDVTYLGDITVANFPGEVSTFVNRQHKIKPDVTLRNGTSVTDVKILVGGNELPWSSSYATYEQNGTNLVITGKNNGSETVTVRYQNHKVPEPYVVDRTLKVNVADPIVIQAKLTDGDTHWTKTGLVHIHFWGDHAETAQDLSMSYNEDTKLFSVTAPMISDPFNFMFWYGEDINSCASEAWRKTGNLSTAESACYTIDKTTLNETPRNAEKESALCSLNEYYVEITMKNGNTYKSNTIDELTDLVSFFAPQDGVTDYTGGTVRIVHNGAVSDPVTGFAAAGVYVAQIANASGFVANSIKPYTGNYYIRTDGAHGAWGEYKTDPDNLMTSFTPRAEKGETYSYYWVKNVAKTGPSSGDKTNIKADIANDYNDNLAGMIENDKFTDGGGFVYNSTNGANVRFSYEPTTNEFKRAILGGSSDNNFLNVYSKTNNLYADNAHSKQLNENADLSDSKFSDLSDWVYEKQVYVVADGVNASKVILKSVFNGQTTHLLGYQKNEKGEDTDIPNELEVMGSQSTGNYTLRISYDFKKNRLIASWEPGKMTITEDRVIDSDVLFVQQEAADGTIDNKDVAQITYADDAHNAKLTSLKNMIYVLEVTDQVIDKTQANNQLYWICLPFDCRISDIYGVEGYVTLNAAGQATDGLWGIQRYDGTTRAQHGWFKEDNPEGFWRWMKRDETMKAGTGYVVVFDKTNANSWPSIDVEEACTTGDDCVEGKHTVKKRSKRLYFPSIGSKFEISYAGDGANVVQYADEPCNVTSPVNRTQYDGNWKVIGPVSYNNIGVDNTKQDNLTFYYTYNQSAEQGHRYSEQQTITGSEEFKSFHSYMTQFGGTLTWKPFTKSEDVTLKAPLYTENSEFQGGLLTIELNDAQGKELNHTFINLSKNGTTGFDQNLDLTKITENCAQIASVSEDVLYAGNTLPLDIEMVPLNVKVVANGTYDIALEQSLEGLEVRLYDAFEQTTTVLDMMPATVTLNKGEYKDRFFLQFVQKSPLTPTNLNGAIEQFNLPTDKTQKLLINDNIYLINAGRIYNASGTKVR